MRHLAATLTLLAAAAMPVAAQAPQDSVRVRLETSIGAEIGLDGDISSNNMLAKRIPAGRHTVTVRYGTAYEKEYELDVSPASGQDVYRYPIDGQLSVESVPAGATVYIDGIPQGSTPVALPLLGDHNIRVEKDPETYYEATDRVSVDPFAEVYRSYALRKRPPRLYGMVMATGSAYGFGGFAALCRRFGAFVHVSSSFKNGLFQYDPPGGGLHYADTDGYTGTGYYKEDGHAYGTVTCGFMARCHKYVYAYIGAGYGEYARKYVKDESIAGNALYPDVVYPYGSQGAAIDVGVIAKWKALLVSCGYTTIAGKHSPSGSRSNEVYVGLGFTIHKNKKR